jgi:3-hydroxyisobutyrate dehydrogenase
LIEKDLMLAMEVANASKARLPLGAQAHQLYGLLCEQGYGDKDFSVVYEFLTKMMKK